MLREFITLIMLFLYLVQSENGTRIVSVIMNLILQSC